MMDPAFFEVHKDLPREGPGLPEDVHWALEHCATTPSRVLDAACGPGADTVALAQALPGAQIAAVELHPGFVAQTRARCAVFGARVEARVDDMFAPEGPFDLIWCAGAAYFVGLAEALTRWQPHLSPDGIVAVSEPFLPAGAGAPAQAFWHDYPQITDAAGVLAQVRDAGFEPRASRVVSGPAWEAYYAPLQARLDQLRTQDPEPALVRQIDEAQHEIDMWRVAPDQIAYLLVIAAR